MHHRLWFRLDDVLPLAEHAMACPTHQLTDAQVRAGQPLRPALYWTGSPKLDILQSNGIPAWHGVRGTIHAAEAHTWRHTATGRYGAADIDGYHTGYLPLGPVDGQPALIVALRDAVAADRHWMWVDIDPADAHLIDHRRVGFAEDRPELVPVGTIWTPAMVTCDAVAGAAYRALIPDGYTTDSGYLLPRFDLATVVRLIADLDAMHARRDRSSDPTLGRTPTRRLFCGRFGNVVLIGEELDDGTTTSSRRVDAARCDADQRYSVGAYTWPWQLAS
ncbi:hypothetical protein [Dactylosporangium cerinum]